MKSRIPHPAALGGLAGGVIATGIGFLLAVSAPAAPLTLSVDATSANIGQTIHATARLSESESASGEIAFEVFGPDDPTCLGPALTPAPAAAVVSGDGDYASGEFTPPSAGAYYWSAHYSGDLENPSADAICAAISTIDKASPDLAGSASGGGVGTAIGDEVTLTGGFSPSGEVTFSVYGPGDSGCTGLPLETTSAPIQSTHATSPGFLAQQAGEFHWTAEYPGDANNEAASLGCGAANQTSVVSKASPTLTGLATSTVKVGTAIADSATLAGGFAAGDHLTFRAYGPGNTTCNGTPAYEAPVAVNGNGSYSPAGFSPGPGLYRWTVQYPGDANNEAASLGCGAANQTSTVSKASPTLSGAATSVKVGLSIADSVTLTGGFSPSGEVTFSVYGPGDSGCTGLPLETTSAPIQSTHATSPGFLAQQAGEFHWTAEYPGDANNEAASLGCGAANQTSVVSKASPTLTGLATSTVKVGTAIADSATLAGGFAAGDHLTFRAYGPGNTTCNGTPAYEAPVAVNGNGSYSPAGFSPGPGLYRWTVQYPGDVNNEAASLGCGAANQSSAVGVIAVTLAAGATNATVGNPVTAAATIKEGAIPTGQVKFDAFSPGDTDCSKAAVFSSTIGVSGNGSYRSAAFVPTRVGAFRWSVSYSGDANHSKTAVGCGKAVSSISKAGPSIAGQAKQQLKVGASFRDTATLQGGYSPTGTITFRIYGPTAASCSKPMLVDTIAIAGNGTYRSDPFVPGRPGRYSFVATYSGDAANQAASEPCDSPGQVVLVQKRTPKVKPRALLVGGKQISIRARLAGGASPSGVINFRLYGPGDKRCTHKPLFSGGITVKSNGNYSLAKYIARKPGLYHLSVGYSGDRRNKRYEGSCANAQSIRVG